MPLRWYQVVRSKNITEVAHRGTLQYPLTQELTVEGLPALGTRMGSALSKSGGSMRIEGLEVARHKRGPGVLFYLLMMQLGSQVSRQSEKPRVTLGLMVAQIILYLKPTIFLVMLGLESVSYCMHPPHIKTQCARSN
eukprot:SAG11_NODE_575_length_8420_cov_2.398149_3_plen_137_part_00